MLTADAQDPEPTIRQHKRFDILCSECQIEHMSSTTDGENTGRREKILLAARWCFLNFGFSKTTFDDIAKRATLSRTLLYRIFKNKEEIYQAVFVDWLVARSPAAKQVASGAGRAHERLLSVCRLMAIEPWAEMVTAPMGHAFHDVCQRIDPNSEALYRRAMHECVAAILDDDANADVFLLALGGLFSDQPSVQALESRTQILVERFAPRSSRKPSRPRLP